MKCRSRLRQLMLAGAAISGLQYTSTAQQFYTPNSLIGASLNGAAPFSGIGLNNPKGMLEIELKCASSSLNGLGGLVITDNELANTCTTTSDKGDMMYVRKVPVSGPHRPFFIVKNSGRTGVGTSQPAAQLEVKSLGLNNIPFQVTAFDGTPNLLVNQNKNVGIGVSSNILAKLHVNNVGSSLAPLLLQYDGADYTYGLLYQYQGAANYHKAFAVNRNGSDVFVVNANGYTTIGSFDGCANLPQYGIADPDYKLVVDDGIITEKVRVAVECSADWADHVFDEHYKLKTIEEVAAYIRNNKHLPDVPSAADMVANGNNLGQTDALLLQKIEELTLYIIQQQQQITDLTRQISQYK